MRDNRFTWTLKQEQTIREMYAILGPTKLAKKMGVTKDALVGKARCMGIRFRQFRWTEDKLQILRDRYQTDGPAVLAAELGVSTFTVTAKARRLGIGSTRKLPDSIDWTEDKLQALRDRYVTEGGNVLAKEFGYRLAIIRAKASEMGLHTIVGHARAGRIRAENAGHLDIHFFDKWSPDMAYVLGLLFADGTTDGIGSVRINLKRSDEAVLRFVKMLVKVTSKIHESDARLDKRTGNWSEPQSTLIMSSTVLIRRMLELGLKPRKTYNDDPFPEVPDEMMPHFVRGYFDGDGGVSIYKDRDWDACSVNFVGSPRFITGIRDTLVRMAGMSCRAVILKHGKTAEWATVAWTANKDLRLFHQFVYPDGFGFCLQRKKDRLDEWLSVPRKEVEYRPWTDEEKDQVRNLYHILGPTKLAQILDRDRVTLINQAQRLGVLTKEPNDPSLEG